MTKHVDLIAVGDTVAVVVPPDIAARLGLQPGGTVSFDDQSNTIKLTAVVPEFDRQMAVAREVMRKDWNILRALAK